MAKGAKAKRVRGKKPKKPVQNNQLFKNYEVSGDTLKRTHRSCPKCGPGVSLAKHKDRTTCGKCGYTEFVIKSKDPSLKK